MSGANRSRKLQDRCVQSVTERQGLFNDFQASRVQYEYEHQRGTVPPQNW